MISADDMRIACAYHVALRALRCASETHQPEKQTTLFAALLSLWSRLPRELRVRAFVLGLEYGGPRWRRR